MKLTIKAIYFLLFILITLLLNNCYNERERINYMDTNTYGKYYLEWYEPSKGGVYASSICTCFFTDSLNNRIFIASCHDDEYIDRMYDSTYFICLKYTEKKSYNSSKTYKVYIDTIIVNTKNMVILNKNDMI